MPTADPQVIRQNIKMMQGMNDDQFNSFRNMVSILTKNLNKQAQNMNYPFTPSQTANTSSTSTGLPSYPDIEKIKNEGNELFKSGEYDKAAAKYLEVLMKGC